MLTLFTNLSQLIALAMAKNLTPKRFFKSSKWTNKISVKVGRCYREIREFGKFSNQFVKIHEFEKSRVTRSWSSIFCFVISLGNALAYQLGIFHSVK